VGQGGQRGELESKGDRRTGSKGVKGFFKKAGNNWGLNMRKNFFTLRVTEPWPRLPRDVVESHLLLWRYSRPAWTRSSTTYCR